MAGLWALLHLCTGISVHLELGWSGVAQGEAIGGTGISSPALNPRIPKLRCVRGCVSISERARLAVCL